MGKQADALAHAIEYVRKQCKEPARILLSAQQAADLAYECGRVYEMENGKRYKFHGVTLLEVPNWPHDPTVLDADAFQDYLDRRSVYVRPAPSKQFRGQ